MSLYVYVWVTVGVYSVSAWPFNIRDEDEEGKSAFSLSNSSSCSCCFWTLLYPPLSPSLPTSTAIAPTHLSASRRDVALGVCVCVSFWGVSLLWTFLLPFLLPSPCHARFLACFPSIRARFLDCSAIYLLFCLSLSDPRQRNRHTHTLTSLHECYDFAGNFLFSIQFPLVTEDLLSLQHIRLPLRQSPIPQGATD